ncbi:hypothetical protein ACPXB3_14880 [Gordonia sp. DT219]|uniref:hypothetical protein n=1 Tax=Gordonia sp. DT219 TaxID=3416658 RepID=UPI003CF2965B
MNGEASDHPLPTAAQCASLSILTAPTVVVLDGHTSQSIVGNDGTVSWVTPEARFQLVRVSDRVPYLDPQTGDRFFSEARIRELAENGFGG